MELIALAIVVVLIGIWSHQLYDRHSAFVALTEPAHLSEIATALAQMKNTLRDKPDGEIPLHCTSKGVALSYAVTQTSDKTRWLHHISISRKSGHFHARNAAFLGAYSIKSLNVESWLKQMSTKNRRVMHLAFTIDAENQETFMNKDVEDLKPNIKELLAECNEIKIKKLAF